MTTPRRSASPSSSTEHAALTGAVTAPNYAPLPVVVAEAHGAWVTDVDGRRYLDCLAGYSALTSATGTRCCSGRPASSWSG